METKEEKAKKAQALEGKSYLLVNQENDSRKTPSENEGSEYLERKPNEQDQNDEQKENIDYDKAKR